jgi:hypothetical protein
VIGNGCVLVISDDVIELPYSLVFSLTEPSVVFKLRFDTFFEGWVRDVQVSHKLYLKIKNYARYPNFNTCRVRM